MQIHELNNFSGAIGAGSYVAIDDGSDTGKLSVTQLLASTEEEINALDTALNARIDNIIAGGDAPSEAEIIDARLGAAALGSIPYASLGDAIRGQVSDLDSALNGVDNIGLTLSNYYVKSSDGSLESNAGYRCSQLIPVKEGEKYAYSVYASSSVLSVALYEDDSSNALLPPVSIKGITSLDTGVITIPSGINYIRVSCSYAQISDLYLKQIYTALDDVTLALGVLNAKSGAIDIIKWNMCERGGLETLENTFINGTTVTGGQANFYSMRYFPVDANTLYKCSSGENVNPPRFVNFYDSGKNYLSKVDNASSFTTPNDCAFISVTFYYATPSLTTPIKGDKYVKRADTPEIDRISFSGNKISNVDIYNFNSGVNSLVKKSRSLCSAEHRCAVINFQFDDGNAKDANIVEIFRAKNAVCGFALISNISASRINEYLGYQEEGFEILSHSTDGNPMSDGTIPSSTIETKLRNSKKVLSGYGFNIRGWVTPDSTMNAVFIPLLNKYYDFAYTVYFGGYNGTGTPYFDKTADMNKLSRVSVQNTTLANMKLAVDNAIANKGFLTFYGHSAQLDGTDYETTANLNELLDYINSKQENQDCLLLAPSDAADFYFHVRHEDYLELLNA